MNNDLVDIFLLSLVSMFNPTLLAAVTVMMLRSRSCLERGVTNRSGSAGGKRRRPS